MYAILYNYQAGAYGKVAVFEDLYGNRWDLIDYRS
jgi:hypothetical protein